MFLTFTTGIMLTATSIAQTSLWERRDPAFVNAYADVKAKRPGDILIVQINERSNVQNRDQRMLQKNNQSDSDAGFGASIGGLFGNNVGDMNFDQSSSALRQYNGNTQFRSERGLVDQFTVSVVDITPNGNLLITGSRHVGVEGDTRKLVLTGIVRAADVRPDNTIASSRVADLDIRYEAADDEGAERRFFNQGWLGRKLNKVWPH